MWVCWYWLTQVSSAKEAQILLTFTENFVSNTTNSILFSLPSNNKSDSMAKEEADSVSKAATQTERVVVVPGL